MLRLIGLVVSIGIADSLNPSTIAPALFLAGGERGRGRVAEFTVAVFLVYLLGGVVIALGPGQLVLSLLPHPRHHVRYVIEIAVGVAMIGVAMLLWRHRAQLTRRTPPEVDPYGRSSWLLGATITAIELPTAFPYFAVLAAIVGSGLGLPRQMMLLVLFNVCFVLPLVGIVATLTFAGDHATRMLAAGRRFLQRHWPIVLASLALAAGVFVIVLGATGLAAARHGRFGRFARRLHGIFRP